MTPWCSVCGMLKLNGACLCNRPPEPAKRGQHSPYRKKILDVIGEVLPNGSELSSGELVTRILRFIPNADRASVYNHLYEHYADYRLVRREEPYGMYHRYFYKRAT